MSERELFRSISSSTHLEPNSPLANRMIMMLAIGIMSIRTTVTLDEDILERVKRESRSRGASFRDTLNDLLRTALLQQDKKPHRRKLKITPVNMGFRGELNYDNIESLLEYGEGERHL
jgi:hypothetical protein